MMHERWGATEEARSHRRLGNAIAGRPSLWPRRVVLCLLVGAALLVLAGCAGYSTTRPAKETGRAEFSWIFGAAFEDDRCAEVLTIGPGSYILRIKGAPPTFNDRLECLGHEMLHLLGASHE